MQAAICAQFVALGLPPRRAGVLAELFMNFGHGDIRDQGRRNAGQLFPTGTTLLVAYPAGPQDKKELWMSEAINVIPESKMVDLFLRLNGGREIAAVILNLTELYGQVQRNIGADFSAKF